MRPFEGVPNLALVPTDRIRFHEHPEAKRTLRLVERLKSEARLRNPPIVASLGPDDWMLLDGANRVSAFRKIGWSHVPVQIIDYGSADVQLKGWHHLLLEGKALDLQARFAELPGVHVERIADGELEAHLELRRVHAILVDDATTAWGLFPRNGTVQVGPWMKTLERVVASYEGRSRLERIKLADYENLPDVFRAVEHQLVLFPAISKPELLGLVREGRRIPTGITRHLIPGRALGLYLALGFLSELPDEAAKQAHFRAIVDGLEMAGRIRYYEESVFIMNE
jgi:hypothetical protein